MRHHVSREPECFSRSGEVMSEKSELLESCVGCMMSRMVKLLDIKKAEEAGAKVNNVYFPECQVYLMLDI